MKDANADWKCDKCGKKGALYEMGYIGPKDRNDKSCRPFMEQEVLCIECERKRQEEEDVAGIDTEHELQAGEEDDEGESPSDRDEG